jgi:hypothetical protein
MKFTLCGKNSSAIFFFIAFAASVVVIAAGVGALFYFEKFPFGNHHKGSFNPSKHKNFDKFATGKCKRGYMSIGYRIEGGVEINSGKYPFIARLIAANSTHESIFCGGSLISSKYAKENI